MAITKPLTVQQQQAIDAMVAAGIDPTEAERMLGTQQGSTLFPDSIDNVGIFGSTQPTTPPIFPKTTQYEGYTGYPTEFKTREEYGNWAVTQGRDRQGAMEAWDKFRENDPNNPKNVAKKYQGIMPLLYPGGSDPTTEAYVLGKSIGLAPGTKGKGLGIASSAGALALGLGRTALSGFANQKMNQAVDQWNRQQLYGVKDKDYTANPQYQNQNNQGGKIAENGGLFSFEEGGFLEGDEAEEQNNQTEESGEDKQMPPQIQEAMGRIAQAIQQGQPPQMIIQALVKNGMPEQQATQLVSMVVQKLQEGNSEESDDQEDQTPMMKRGGTFKYKVGDYIKFKHNGELKEGKIKRIENGKIFL